MTPAVAKRLRASEAQIESGIRDYLHLHGWITIKTEAGEASKIKNYNKLTGRISSSIAPGDPDLRAFRGNLALHLETKTPVGRLSPTQKLRHAYLEQFGIKVHVVRSLDDIKAILASTQ